MPDLSSEILYDGPVDGALLVLAHGAGVGMRHSTMVTLAYNLASHGLRVVRFQFPYMTEGRSRPDQEQILLETWRMMIDRLGDAKTMTIGGRSLGGAHRQHGGR